MCTGENFQENACTETNLCEAAVGNSFTPVVSFAYHWLTFVEERREVNPRTDRPL